MSSGTVLAGGSAVDTLTGGARLDWRDEATIFRKSGMSTLRLGLVSVFAATVWASPCFAAEEQKTSEADKIDPTQITAQFLTVSGRALMPGGAPAAAATVIALPDDDWHPITVRANEAGQFQLRGMFANGCQLHASTADGGHQAVLRIAESAARKVLATPVEIRLEPADSLAVTVLADKRPVQGAQLVTGGSYFRCRAVTGRDGRAVLRVPSGELLRELEAWHPELGVDGKYRDRGLTVLEPEFGAPHEPGLAADAEGQRPRSATLALHAPSPYTIHVVDSEGKGVGDIELAINIAPEGSDWIVFRDFPGAHVRTDAHGKAIVPWMPRVAPMRIDVEIFGTRWHLNSILNRSHPAGTTIVQVSSKKNVVGRLLLPEVALADGILIKGYGFGAGKWHVPRARARQDGSFTLAVLPEYAYCLAIVDDEWASDVWSGLILSSRLADPARLQIEAYRATAATVRVTAGDNREPVANAWVDSSRPGKLDWVDSAGQSHSGAGAITVRLRTGPNGEVRAGIARGQHLFRVVHRDWDEQKTVDVESADPAVVDFSRTQVGDKHFSGQLVRNGLRYEPSKGTAARAWSVERPHDIAIAQSWVQPDGTFHVAIDAGTFSLLAMDLQNRRSGFARIAREVSAADLPMHEMASYRGKLLDDNAQPVAEATVRISLLPRSRDLDVAPAQTTDSAGQFRFRAVPAGVPLHLLVEHPKLGSRYVVAGSQLLFEPGERREIDSVVAHRINPSVPTDRRPLPAELLVTIACRDARLNGMLAVAVLAGDESKDVTRLRDRLLILLTADQLANEASFFSSKHWMKPGRGELTLVVLDQDGRMIAAERLRAGAARSAAASGAQFLRQHAAPVRDARQLLAAAEIEAQATGRRVWLIENRPRCEPGFQFARWMDNWRDTIEKDYVIVRITDLVDERVDEVRSRFGKQESTVPWCAILEPDGKLLIGGDGLPGHSLLPNSVEDIRRIKEMLRRTVRKITPAEVEVLVESLLQTSDGEAAHRSIGVRRWNT